MRSLLGSRFSLRAPHCHSPIGIRLFPRLSYTYHGNRPAARRPQAHPRVQNNQTPAYLAGHSPNTSANIFREHNQIRPTPRPPPSAAPSRSGGSSARPPAAAGSRSQGRPSPAAPHTQSSTASAEGSPPGTSRTPPRTSPQAPACAEAPSPSAPALAVAFASAVLHPRSTPLPHPPSFRWSKKPLKMRAVAPQMRWSPYL